jgi:hypothetical protein
MVHVGKMEEKIFHAMGIIGVCGIFVGCMNVHVIVINYIDVFALDKHEVVDNGYVCSDC